MAKDWGERIERANRARAAAQVEVAAVSGALADRIIEAGMATVQYEPLPVQAATVAYSLYPDTNRAAS